MQTVVTVLHVFVCLFLIGVVLLQSGRAGGMGVLSGATTQTVFGGRGAGNFLQRVTAVCAMLFIVTCSALAYMSSATRDRDLARNTPAATPASTSPAAPAAAPSAAPATAPSAPTAVPTSPIAPVPAPTGAAAAPAAAPTDPATPPPPATP